MATLSSETRQATLDAAARLFAAQTFDKVRMEDVAAEAGIGKVTIYRYFATKETLYTQLLEEIGRDYLGLLQAAERSVRGCRGRLVALVRVALDYFAGKPWLLRLLDRAGIDRDRQTTFPWLEVQRQMFQMLERLFAEGVVRKEFLVDDLELAVRGLIGAMRFSYLYPCLEVARDELPEKLVGMLVRPVEAAATKRAA
jgi:AcrR family transcriptional regulator